MTVPPHECATSTVGPFCWARMRRVSATESASEVSGFCTAVTCKPVAWSRAITAAQLEPSAHAPCTRTTLRAMTGLWAAAASVGWGADCAWHSVATSRLAVPTNLAEAVIDLTPLSSVAEHAPGLLIDYFERRASHFTCNRIVPALSRTRPVRGRSTAQRRDALHRSSSRQAARGK